MGKVVSAQAKVLNGTKMLKTDYTYDGYGRLLKLRVDNHLDGQDLTTNTYNHADWLLGSAREHLAWGKPLTIVKTHTYDGFGRRTQTSQSVNGQPGVLSQCTYNDRDQLTRRRLGGGLQSIDYSYNTRGWLTRVNDPLGPKHADPLGGDLFYMQLYYDSGQSQVGADPQYNGNIAHMVWQVAGGERKAYGFGYDTLNRLTRATYADLASSGVYTVNENYSLFGVSYDDNGNLKGLSRNGLYPSGASLVKGLIDKLHYSYNGNQLISVGELAGGAAAASGFAPSKVSQQSLAYSYDKNGNLTHDPHKGLQFAYNHLNLPEQISGKANIAFTYDAAGNKLRKEVVGLEVRDYVGGIEYRNGALEAIHHEEGRTLKNQNGQFVNEFFIRDHLGSVRVVFADKNGDGKIQLDNPATPAVNESEILQENHYYPFGMPMTGPWAAGGAPLNRYRYNGMEYNEDAGLNWYDYGARWYDPAIGRWGSVDPLAAQYAPHSPYSYALNRPINAVDPDGRLVIFVNGFMADQWAAQDNRRTIRIPQYGGDVALHNPRYRPYPPERTFTRGGPEYLGERFGYWQDKGADLPDLYRQGFGDGNHLFVSATADNGSQAMDRFNEGQAAARSLIEQIEKGDIALGPNETIKIVGHSQGAAFAAGMAWTLANNEKYAKLLEAVHYIAPHQPGDFYHPATIAAVQFSTKSDLVSSAQWIAPGRSNPLMLANGGSSYAQIRGVPCFVQRGYHPGGRRGHSAWTYLDEIATYFRGLGVPVTVRN